MTESTQARDERHFREVERIMLLIDEASRKAARSAKELSDDGSEHYLVAALETASAALRAEHKRLMRGVYWRAPGKDGQPELIANDSDEQERLAG